MGSSRRIAIVCEDAGAAAALMPLVRKLRAARGGVELFATGRAAELFASGGLSMQPPDALVLDGLGVLVTGTTAWGERVEARAVVQARSRGVPSVSFVDFWSNYEARFRLEAERGLDALPDVIAVVDAPMRDALIALGLDSARVVVTGSPAFDAASAAPPTTHERQPHVLFLSQPLLALYGPPTSEAKHPVGYTEREVLTLLAAACAAEAIPLRVRPHPREDVVALTAFVEPLPGGPRVTSEGRLADAVALARGVVAMTTAGLVEAALAGATTLSIQPTDAPTVLPTIASGLTTLARDAQGIARWLAALPAADAARTHVPAVVGTPAIDNLVSLVDSQLRDVSRGAIAS
jgi:hypothetical protein